MCCSHIQPFLLGGASVPLSLGIRRAKNPYRPMDGNRLRRRGGGKGRGRSLCFGGDRGRIADLGIKDAANMGAAMAPAAAQTLRDFLSDTGTNPQDYDLILTGDLGEVGSKLLYEILSRENVSIQENHQDCGLLIYDRQAQDVHAGGSGCGCSASVLCSVILKKMQKGQLRNILFMATGALMSPTSSQQGESIPGVAHLINIRI